MKKREKTNLAEVHHEEGRVTGSRVEEENAARSCVVATRFAVVIAILQSNRDPGPHKSVAGAVHDIQNR